MVSILSLPNETLLAIQDYLPPFPYPQPGGLPQEPLIQLNPVLRSLCSTNKRLRDLCYPSLCETVVINLKRDDLDSQCALLMNSFLKDDNVLALVK